MRAAAMVVVTVAWWTVAAAADPVDLPLADDPVAVGSDYLTLRPLADSQLDPKHHRVVFDSGGTQLVMTYGTMPLAAGSGLAQAIASSLVDGPRELRDARVERLGLASGLDALAVVPTHPGHANDVLFEVYVTAIDGVVHRLSFYVEDDDSARDLSWRAVAERIARSVETAPFETTRFGAWTVALPPGSTVTKNGVDEAVFDLAGGLCMVSKHDANPVHDGHESEGTLFGRRVTWYTTRRSESSWHTYAELDGTHVRCVCSSKPALTLAHLVARTLAPAP